MKNEKLWSLKIPIKISTKDKDIEKFFKICKSKLGLIPNIIKTNSIDKKKFDAFNIFYKMGFVICSIFTLDISSWIYFFIV